MEKASQNLQQHLQQHLSQHLRQNLGQNLSQNLQQHLRPLNRQYLQLILHHLLGVLHLDSHFYHRRLQSILPLDGEPGHLQVLQVLSLPLRGPEDLSVKQLRS